MWCVVTGQCVCVQIKKAKEQLERVAKAAAAKKEREMVKHSTTAPQIPLSLSLSTFPPPPLSLSLVPHQCSGQKGGEGKDNERGASTPHAALHRAAEAAAAGDEREAGEEDEETGEEGEGKTYM